MHCKLSERLSNKKQQQHSWDFEQLTRTYTELSHDARACVCMCAWARSNISMPSKKKWELSNINSVHSHAHIHLRAPYNWHCVLWVDNKNVYTQNSFSVGWFVHFVISFLLSCVVVFWSILCMCVRRSKKVKYKLSKSEARQKYLRQFLQ